MTYTPPKFDPRKAKQRGCVEARFWSKVDKQPGDGCWVWTAATTGGYGTFWVAGRLIRAHRWAFEDAYGPIPDGIVVAHRCDNPPCVRPTHLFAGSQADNNLDARHKGRHAGPRGETHPHAKLTDAQVAEIKSRYHAAQPLPRGRAGTGFVGQLAAEYGICKQYVYSVVNGRWRGER